MLPEQPVQTLPGCVQWSAHRSIQYNCLGRGKSAAGASVRRPRQRQLTQSRAKALNFVFVCVPEEKAAAALCWFIALCLFSFCVEQPKWLLQHHRPACLRLQLLRLHRRRECPSLPCSTALSRGEPRGTGPTTMAQTAGLLRLCLLAPLARDTPTTTSSCFQVRSLASSLVRAQVCRRLGNCR
jgi:hypothetical protein